MKFSLTLLVCGFMYFASFSQEEKFRIKGQLKDNQENAVEDAYVINFRDQIGINSNKQGEFTLWVNKGDSLMIVHLAFVRKKIYADSLNAFGIIILEPEIYEIGNTTIFSKLKEKPSEISESLDFEKYPIKIKFGLPDSELKKMGNLATQENKIFRSEATSIKFLSFSPSYEFKKLKRFIKKKF